jgi:hypothetical protein
MDRDSEDGRGKREQDQVAERLADDVFGEFMWERVGPKHINWSCSVPELHGAGTHRADVVSYYDRT